MKNCVKISIPVIAFFLVFLFFTACDVEEKPVQLEPFQLNHWDGNESRIDLSFLLDAPAGKDGYITAEGEHFYTPDGEQIRFLGVNITDWSRGSTMLPSKENAEVWASMLARHGINIVRLHFLDFQAPRGLIDADRDDTRHFDPEQLDRFDYWVYQLKQHGIYVNFNLVVGRTYKEGDDVVDYDDVGWAKYITYFDPQLIRLQKELAEKWLTHTNPYTGLQYKDDPAVVMFELLNENTFSDGWHRGSLYPPDEPVRDPNFKPITPYYSDMLTDLFNEYLQENYTATEIAELRSEAGVAEREPIPRLRKSDVTDWEDPGELFHALWDFYMHVERSYYEEMKSYLKDELGLKSLLYGTADFMHERGGAYPLAWSHSTMDFLGGHMYWQHPNVEGEVNTPMVNDPGFSNIMRLSRTAVAGKPYAIPETNNPSPNFYDSEGIPVLASYGSLQDWSAIIMYTFEPKESRDYDALIGDSFDISHHPVKMPQMAAAALMFGRGDVSPANQTLERTYTREQLQATMVRPHEERPYYTPEFDNLLVLKHKVRIGSFDGPPTQEQQMEQQNPIVSDTGELAWYLPEGEQGGMVTISAPRSQGMIGFIEDYDVEAGNLSVELKNDFASIILSSLDRDPRAISESSRMLLVTGARAENTGTVWDEPQMRITERGDPPSRIEVVRGEVTLRGLQGATAVQIHALDGSGRWMGEPVQAESDGSEWRFPIGDKTTTWYEIVVQR